MFWNLENPLRFLLHGWLMLPCLPGSTGLLPPLRSSGRRSCDSEGQHLATLANLSGIDLDDVAGRLHEQRAA